MAGFSWFPIGTSLNAKYQSSTLLNEGNSYQIIALKPDDKVALVLNAASSLSAIWLPLLRPMMDLGQVFCYAVGKDNYYIWLFDKADMPLRVLDIPQSKGLLQGRELISLARAIRALPHCCWGDALYLPHENLCIPINENAESAGDKRKLAVLLLTGGVGNPQMDFDQIRLYNIWLTLADIQEFMQVLGILNENSSSHDNQLLGTFKLPGRPKLEAFFNEYVVDYYRDLSHYKEMGICPPNGILLYGPPGTGKTFAVKKLAEFLDWPVRQIDFGSVGSPYIHQTGLRLRQEFGLAAQEAPSIIIMDEIDAMGANRNILDHHSQIEEISELLRLLETSAEKNILVVGTTNRWESLDPALTRKGRFNYHLQVDYAVVEEILQVLTQELNKRRFDQTLDLEPYAQRLQGRPLSDVSWIVNEAGRLAVRHKCAQIDAWSLNEAFKNLS